MKLIDPWHAITIYDAINKLLWLLCLIKRLFLVNYNFLTFFCSVFLSLCLSVFLSFCLSVFLSFFLYFCPVFLPFCLAVCLSVIGLSEITFIYEAITCTLSYHVGKGKSCHVSFYDPFDSKLLQQKSFGTVMKKQSSFTAAFSKAGKKWNATI